MRSVALLRDVTSGRKLEVLTTQPAIQVYPGNWLSGSAQGKGGRGYNDNEGVALECQGMPDAPNHANFPSQVLHKGETYEQGIVFRFFV